MKKYFTYIAVCIMAAFALTSCDNDDDAPATLVKKTFVATMQQEGHHAIQNTISFIDEQNAIFKAETATTLPNGTEMPVVLIQRATYSVKDGVGTLHIDRVKSTSGTSSFTMDVDLTWKIAFDAKSNTLQLDDVLFTQAQYVPQEWVEDPVTSVGTLPTLDQLKGAWYGVGTAGKGFYSVNIEVTDNTATLTMLKNGERTPQTYTSNVAYDNGTLTIGNHKVVMSTMDTETFIKSANVYEGNKLICTVWGLKKN